MKITKIFSSIVLAAAALGLAACADTDAQYSIPTVASPQLVKSYPAEGEVLASDGDVTITLTYDKNVFFSSAKASQLQLTGGTIQSAKVYGSDSVLTITANVSGRGTSCSLTVPEGLVTGPNKMPAPEVTVNFSTKPLPTIATTPVMATSAKAKALYSFLLDNYKTNIISGMMANVAWNNTCSEQVYEWTGKYPAINGYDYIHLPASVQGANWINYGDITPVKEWTDNNGIAAIGWHWLASTVEISEDGSTPDVPVTPTGDAVWEGSTDMGTSWGANVTVSADKFASVAEGMVLTTYFSQNSDATYWQVKAMDGNWTTLTSYADRDNGWGCIDTSAGDTYVTITLNAADAEALKSTGLILSGYGLTYSKITLSDATRSRTKAITRASSKGYSDLDPNKDFSYSIDAFDLDNAVTEGTWENDFVKADLARITVYLKLLQEANIPVLWRPLHEASGGWFWWGKDAASFKKLWIMMFDYFKSEGIDNLIWVWTSQGDDDDWYPGDAYVDIIGRDLYGNTAASCVEEYENLLNKYGKIVTLSECGYSTYSNSRVATIADQWEAGAKWSWFMPWYDGDDTTSDAVHSNQEWWQAAMEMTNVITRDKVNY